MKFVHRSAFRVEGIRVPSEETLEISQALDLQNLDPRLFNWLTKLGLTELAAKFRLTTEKSDFTELDLRMAIANFTLNATGDFSVSIEEGADVIRADRDAHIHACWMFIEITGEYEAIAIDRSAMQQHEGFSYEHANNPSVLNELNRPVAKELHQMLLGALQLSVGHDLEWTDAGQTAWFQHAGKPLFRLVLSSSAKALAIKAPPPNMTNTFNELVGVATRNLGLQRALIAFGQSRRPDLDPTLEFLSAFAALEQLVKARTPSMTSTNLSDRFDHMSGDQEDGALFRRLNGLRNDLAHEARFDVSTGREARQLFAKYFMSRIPETA